MTFLFTNIVPLNREIHVGIVTSHNNHGTTLFSSCDSNFEHHLGSKLDFLKKDSTLSYIPS